MKEFIILFYNNFLYYFDSLDFYGKKYGGNIFVHYLVL